MTETTEFWKGSFGDEYLARNQVYWPARMPFWKKIADFTGARSVLEIGCNAGWNLSAIRRVYPDIQVYGEDINESAILQACEAGLDVNYPVSIHGNRTELVFTAGVLIHIAPQELRPMMERIINLSRRYVLAIEYESDEETEIEYRGHKGKLWKRPYGKLYQDIGLTLVDYGDAGEGFDNCKYWLFRKQ